MKVGEVLTVAELKDFYTVALNAEARGRVSKEDYVQLADRVPLVVKALAEEYTCGDLKEMLVTVERGGVKLVHLLGALDWEGY